MKFQEIVNNLKKTQGQSTKIRKSNKIIENQKIKEHQRKSPKIKENHKKSK